MLLLEHNPTTESPNRYKPDPLGLTPIPEDNRQQFLRFMLSQKNEFLFPLSQILEVMQLPLEDIFPVPDMASCVLGVCSWQSETLWLVDLNHLVGYAPLYQQSQLVAPPIVIVVQAEGQSSPAGASLSLGLVVEQVGDVDLFDEASIQMEVGLCPTALEPFVAGYCPQQGGTVLNVSAVMKSSIWRSHQKDNE